MVTRFIVIFLILSFANSFAFTMKAEFSSATETCHQFHDHEHIDSHYDEINKTEKDCCDHESDCCDEFCSCLGGHLFISKFEFRNILNFAFVQNIKVWDFLLNYRSPFLDPGLKPPLYS